MKTTDKMLEATKELWSFYNEHPFVQGIQDGSLEKDKFKYYIMQDYLYLKEYAKVFAIGVAKAKSLETANLFAKYIAVMNGELDVHSGYMGKFKVSQEEIDDIMKYLVEEQGVETLRDQALKLVKEGKTTVDEFNKIIAYID